MITLARTHHHHLIQFGQLVVVTGKRFEPISFKVQNLLAIPNYHLIQKGKPYTNNWELCNPQAVYLETPKKQTVPGMLFYQ